MSNKPFQILDLPREHFPTDHHYVPPKARDEAVIAERVAQVPGVLVLQAERKGIRTASRIIPGLKTPEDVTFAADLLAASGLNSAHYLLHDGEGPAEPLPADPNDPRVQRRCLKLAELATDDPEQRPTTYMLLQSARSDLERAVHTSTGLIEAMSSKSKEVEKRKRAHGRIIGHAALTLSCAAIGDEIGYESYPVSNFDLQDRARLRGQAALHAARILELQIGGTHPSFAHLADPDSDLSVYWRRNAPDGALQAYTIAVEQEQAAA